MSVAEADRLEGKTCVVVGGGGFLGAQLTPKLVALGAKVRVFGRTRYFARPLYGAHWTSGTLDDVEKLVAVLSGADIVFHFAGASSPAGAEANRISDLSTNVGGSVALMDLCRHSGVGRIVFASSGGTIYGDAGLPPFSETTLPRPISTYGINKLGVEHYLRLYNHLYGMRNVSLRMANPFGPYQHGTKQQGAISVFTRLMLEDGVIRIWGDGTATRDYLYGGDAADAMIAAALYDGGAEVFNIGSGVGRTLNEVVASLETVLGVTARVEYLPKRAFDVAASILDCRLAETELGWRASCDWNAALALTCDWIRQDVAAERAGR